MPSVDPLRVNKGMKRLWNYIKNRLEETSTRVAIPAAIVSAAALSAPWSYVFVGVSVFFALLPTSGGQIDG